MTEHHDQDDAGMTPAELRAVGPGAYTCQCGHDDHVHGPFCFARGCDCGKCTHTDTDTAPRRPASLDGLLDYLADRIPEEVPDEVAVASLRTHRLIVAVHNDGTTDIQSNLHPRDAAGMLRQLADHYATATAGQDPAPVGEVDEPDKQQPRPRRVLTDDEYQAAYVATRRALGSSRAHRTGAEDIADTMTAALASVGILTPPPLPDEDDGTCTAQFADPDGGWWQCTSEPGHNPEEGHDAGDWAWPADHPDAIAPQDIA